MIESYWEFTPDPERTGQFRGSLVRAMNWCVERGIRVEVFGTTLRVYRASDAIWFEEFLHQECLRDSGWDERLRAEKARFEEIRPGLTE